MIPDKLWNQATQGAAYALPQSARTPSQGVAKRVGQDNKKQQYHDMARAKNPSNVVKNAEKHDWAEADLNRRHTDFQSVALPTELPARWNPMHDAASRPTWTT